MEETRSPPKVLLADDSMYMRHLLKTMLNGRFKVVGEAPDGHAAIELYKKIKPDIVIMDITMPNVCGITAVKSIRDTDPNALIIMCSAINQEWQVKEALRYGAMDFVVKPFSKDRILQALERTMMSKKITA